MLDINLTTKGDKVMIDGLRAVAQQLPKAVNRGLTRSAEGIYRFAKQYLSGPGGASKKVRKDYAGFTKTSGKKVYFRAYRGAGNYPVPVRTGYLRSSLNWLKPGETKSVAAFSDLKTRRTHAGGTFTAGPNEAIIYDSAEYANVIHEGKGSSARFGKRPFMTNALQIFNQGGRIRAILCEEIEKVKKG